MAGGYSKDTYAVLIACDLHHRGNRGNQPAPFDLAEAESDRRPVFALAPEY